jgi:hypothetical protein
VFTLLHHPEVDYFVMLTELLGINNIDTCQRRARATGVEKKVENK